MAQMDRSKGLWKRKPLEADQPEKKQAWVSATPANAGRRLSPDELKAAAAKMGFAAKPR